MAAQGLIDLRRRRNARLHMDVDSTVEPLFGTQQGALPGPNPRYHGRPSYHPLLAAVAETGTVDGRRAAARRCGLRRRASRLRRPRHRSGPSATTQRHRLRAHRRRGRLRRLMQAIASETRTSSSRPRWTGRCATASPCTRTGRPSTSMRTGMPSPRSLRSTSCAPRGSRPAFPCASSPAAPASTRAGGRPRSGTGPIGPRRSS